MLTRLFDLLPNDLDSSSIISNGIVLRLVMVAAAAFLLYGAGDISAAGSKKDDADLALVLISSVLFAYAFGMLVLAVAKIEVNYRNLLIIGAVLLGLFSFYYSTFAKNPRIYLTDVMALSDFSAHMLLKGHNPYSVRDRNVIRQANIATGGLAGMTTDTKGQVINHLMSYPAGNLLPYVGAVAIGVHDMRWIAALSVIGVVIVLWFAAPTALRPFVALPILVSPESVYIHPLAGVADAQWLLPLMCCAVALHAGRDNLAAAAFGWAAATKQQPWLMAPFLLIWIWQEARDRDDGRRLVCVARFASIAAGVFLLINLPFMIWQFPDWLSSMSYVFTAELPIAGSGLSALTVGGLANLSRAVYTALTLTSFVVLLVVYFRYYDTLKYALWIFPGIVFWFALRSYTSYLIYWPPLLLVSVFALWREQLLDEQSDSVTSLKLSEADLSVP